MSDEVKLQTKNFYGTVIPTEWMNGPDGQQYSGFTGKVSLLKDEEIAGFKVTGNDSNWVIRIEGPRSALTIPGCKVRGVWAHDDGAGDTNRNWLLMP